MAGRILVLDDEENYAEMLQDLLREYNYLVDIATRPELAIAQLEETPYDLVISDYKMPVMDGSDFLKKSRELYPDLPFILVSGLMNTPELVKVANMDVTLVMEKPLDTEAFLRHVARFSEPMTEEEKMEYALQKPAEATELAALSYPDEPRFFCANNFLANRFLQSVWSVAHVGSEIFLLDSIGGDAELVLKDLSQWRKNGDMLVEIIDMAGNFDEALGQIQTVLADFENSRVVGVRLASVDAIGIAQKLTKAVRCEIEGSESVLLVYIVADESAARFEVAAGKLGAIVPKMALRPSDKAAYARRFAQITAERLSRTKCAEFTPEAAYAILAYEWPGNYKQIQEVIQKAVNESEDSPLALEVFITALGESVGSVAPGNRISTLMKAEQCSFMEIQMEQLGLTAAELAKKLELDSSIQTKDDLNTMQLLRSELGSF